MTNVVRLSTARKPEKKRSAVWGVQKSGLELVRKRNRKGRPATIREMAKMDWKRWERTEKPGPDAETMDYLGFYSRLAAAIMMKSKPELIESHTKLDHDGMDKMVAGLMDTAEMLKALASVAETAQLQLMVSASAHLVAGGKFKGVHDMRKKRRTLRRA